MVLLHGSLRKIEPIEPCQNRSQFLPPSLQMHIYTVDARNPHQCATRRRSWCAREALGGCGHPRDSRSGWSARRHGQHSWLSVGKAHVVPTGTLSVSNTWERERSECAECRTISEISHAPCPPLRKRSCARRLPRCRPWLHAPASPLYVFSRPRPTPDWFRSGFVSGRVASHARKAGWNASRLRCLLSQNPNC